MCWNISHRGREKKIPDSTSPQASSLPSFFFLTDTYFTDSASSPSVSSWTHLVRRCARHSLRFTCPCPGTSDPHTAHPVVVLHQASSHHPLATFPWWMGHPFPLETLPSSHHPRFSSCLPAQFSVILSQMPIFSASKCQEALGSVFLSTLTL